MQNKNFIRNLVFAKLALVVLVFAATQGWIQVGDRSLIAADQAGPQDKSNATKDAEESTDAKDEKVADEGKKSFLTDLFELPKLDSKNAKKEEIGKYLDMADRKEKQIKAREAMLAKREEKLKALEKSIDEKLQKMDEERKFIAKTLQDEKDLKGERLEKLISLYDKMEPKKAAPQIEKLDKDLVVGLFKGLKQKQVTTILEAMNPEKSVEITEYFGRVKSGREYDLLKELNSSLKKEFADCKEATLAQQKPKEDEKSDTKTSKTDTGTKAAATPPEGSKSQPAH